MTIFEMSSSLPLIKENNIFDEILTPKISFRLNPKNEIRINRKIELKPFQSIWLTNKS